MADPPGRPPGRPPGAKTAVLRAVGALGRHHFAFLRSTFLGVDAKRAWQRYLAFGELSDDRRHIARRQRALLQQVLDAGQEINRTLPDAERIDADLALLARPPAVGTAVPLPTLEEFAAAQGLDRDFLSEAELRQEYLDFYQVDSTPSPAPPAAAEAPVRALHRLEALLARAPAAADPLALWCAPALAQRLRAAGIGTLGALADTVRAWGAGWHRRVRGLGAARAATLLDWLAPHALAFDRPLPDAALAPAPRALRLATLRRIEQPPRHAVVPLERLALPPALAGGGAFATGQPNHLGAADDLQAVRAWLALHADRPSTWRAYRKEAERFVLWCAHVRRKPLSGVDSTDGAAYRAFLADPPTDWVQPVAVPRDDPAWRPFRGPLQPASQRYALQVVRTMFDGLQAANVLVGNPMNALARGSAPRRAALDAERSFTAAEWAFVRARLDALDDGSAEAFRLRLVLDLGAATGLRLAELCGATTADIRHVRVDGEDHPAPLLRVRGKGGREREVPLDPALLPRIARHQADAAAVAPLPSPAPLVCTLQPRPPRWRGHDDGGISLVAADLPAGRALGAAGLYAVLKRFFRRIAADAHAVDGLSRVRLEAASTHWLRHTFARRGAAAQVPVEVLQQALGHASLATTTVYLTTERSRMIKELRKLGGDFSGG